ncbi:MAG: hypothetical protein WCF26_22570 [Candidatus Sulfotelmatobacter sp.]
MPIPSVIGAQNPVVAAQDVLHPFTPEEIDEIRQLKSFVHFTGFIRYKDVFEGEHETGFNQVWSIARMNHLNGEPFTYWEQCGTGGRKRGKLVVAGSMGSSPLFYGPCEILRCTGKTAPLRMTSRISLHRCL